MKQPLGCFESPLMVLKEHQKWPMHWKRKISDPMLLRRVLCSEHPVSAQLRRGRRCETNEPSSLCFCSRAAGLCVVGGVVQRQRRIDPMLDIVCR